jgi:hypothetical protein
MKTIRVFLAIAIFLPIHALSAERATMNKSVVNVTTSSTQVTAGALRILILQNASDTTIWCDPSGGTAIVGQGFALNPAASAGQGGERIVFDLVVPEGAVTCIHGGSGNKVLSVVAG